MKQTVTFSVFQQSFEALRPDNFSYEGLSILFDYLEQYEKDSGTELEFDVIGICCDWSEESWQDIANNYSLGHIIDDPDMDDDDKKQEVIDWLNDQTMVAGDTLDGLIIYCTSF